MNICMYRRHKALIQNSVWPYGSVYGVFGNEFCASGTIRALFKTGLACLRRCVWRQVLIGWRSSASQTVARGQTLQVELFYSWGLEHDVYVVSHTHTHTHTQTKINQLDCIYSTLFSPPCMKLKCMSWWNDKNLPRAVKYIQSTFIVHLYKQ